MRSDYSFFFFNDTATTEIYTLSLHDALPIYARLRRRPRWSGARARRRRSGTPRPPRRAATTAAGGAANCLTCSRSPARSEEHTSELQSQSNLVCRLLLEKKKKNTHVYGLYAD